MTGRVPFELERWKLPLCAAANRYWCLFVSRKLIRPPLQKKSSPYAGRLFRLTYEYHPTGNVNEIDKQMLYRTFGGQEAAHSDLPISTYPATAASFQERDYQKLKIVIQHHLEDSKQTILAKIEANGGQI